MTNNQAIIKELRSMEAWALGLLQSSRRTRELLEKEDVSTPSASSQIDEHVLTAVTKFRQRLNKKAIRKAG